MQTELHRTDRLQMRIAPDVRQLLERAARYEHASLSRFILDNAVKAASQIVAQHEQITLNATDFDAFMHALDTPPAPNNALKDAFAWYNKVHGDA